MLKYLYNLIILFQTASRLQKELEEAISKAKNNEKEKGTFAKKKAPKLGSMPKTPSTEVPSFVLNLKINI